MKSKLGVGAVVSLAIGFSMQAAAANYCLAIRGNGELEPAHWGAVANVVERLGLPQAQAGGSSASITMLLIDAVATNQLVQSASPDDKRTRAALLVKSFEGFILQLTDTPQWREFLLLYQRIGAAKASPWAADLNTLFTSASNQPNLQAMQFIKDNMNLLQANYATGTSLGLISETSYKALFLALQQLLKAQNGSLSPSDFATNLAAAKFYSGELQKAISTFGAFNAETDANLFFRPGLVDFDRLADQFLRIAEFYSMQSAAPQEFKLWQTFVNDCAAISVNHSWEDTIKSQPQCTSDLKNLMTMHFATPMPRAFAQQNIGITIPSFASIAVLTDSANSQARKAAKDYVTKQDPKFGNGFVVSDPEMVKFGYWGHEDLLAKISGNLDSTDEKSRRFMSLGSDTWKTVLGLSPAEPGLSPFKSFTNHNVKLTSAGGWPDLHPMLLLKAMGCENVVYVTRRGGESLFGQGVAKRLLNYSLDWNLISSATPQSKLASAKRNNNGDPNDLISLWSKLYNLANPKSSMRQALDHADAVICTNWDDHEITEGVSLMINDAYNAKYYVSKTSGLGNEQQNLMPRLNTDDQDPAGYPTYAGCY